MNAADLPLPRLREDIRLLTDPRASQAAPEGSFYDPVRDSYFAVGAQAFQLLALWPGARTVGDLARQARAAHGRDVEDAEILELARELHRGQITLEQPGGWRDLAAAAAATRAGPARQALRNYLFFRVPLARPAAFLDRTLPIARLFVGRVALACVATLTALGFYLLLRHWGEASEGLRRQMTLGGAGVFALTLFVMKIFHELGHAYVATAQGVRVRSMGVAFMVMTPMLYTDVTDAWRLPSRRRRMAIDIAGVAVEMAIGGVALFLWAFLPPGAGRDAALVVAVSAWAMSLAVNLSPFMRFDGYYILADMIGVRNLQPRAFALVRWAMREVLFDLGAPCPDALRDGKRAFVIAYGVGTMIYRLFLFLGIALLVYHMFFKLLGLFLFAVEIVVFVIAPVWREVRVWWTMRNVIARRPRAWASAGAAAIGLAALATPLSAKVEIPAVLEPAQFVRLFPHAPAEIRAVHVVAGQRVAAGDVLLTMASPRLEKELEVTLARLALTEQRIARRLGDAKDFSQSLSLDKDRLSLIERRDALRKDIEALSLRAAVDGVVADLDPDLHAGRLLSRQDEIGLIVQGRDTVIRGYADQEDLWRIRAGASARFIPDDAGAAAIAASVAAIAPAASAVIDIPFLAETHGGHVRVHPPQPRQETLAPVDAVHLVTLKPQEGGAGFVRVARGLVVVEGARQSAIASIWRRSLKVLVEEMGV